MILTVDIGNSNIVLSLFNGENVEKSWRVITYKDKSRDEYDIIIKQLLKAHDVQLNDIEGIAISSVVPEVTQIIKDALKFINVKIMVVDDEGIETNIKMSDNIKKEVGSDIQMNIIAGKKRFKENFIIIDMGTATTFDIAVKDGEYVGSIIMPGAKLYNDTLYNNCSKLPFVEIKKPKKFLGSNTTEVMQSGVYYGYIGAIKEIISQIQKNFSNIKFKIYLTGGLSPVFLEDLKFIDAIYPNLTSEGILEVWNINKNK